MSRMLLADAVVVLHFAFVLYVVAGGLLWLRFRRAPLLHLPAVAWSFLLEAAGLDCPLTPLENRLRRAAGGEGYAGDFIAHYLLAVLYPEGLTRAVQVALAVAVVAVNLAVYLGVRDRRRRSARDSTLGSRLTAQHR